MGLLAGMLLLHLASRNETQRGQEELHRHAVENLEWADALLLGRDIFEMMEAARGEHRLTVVGVGPQRQSTPSRYLFLVPIGPKQPP